MILEEKNVDEDLLVTPMQTAYNRLHMLKETLVVNFRGEKLQVHHVFHPRCKISHWSPKSSSITGNSSHGYVT